MHHGIFEEHQVHVGTSDHIIILLHEHQQSFIELLIAGNLRPRSRHTVSMVGRREQPPRGAPWVSGLVGTFCSDLA